jgi:hypothetical protein
MARIDIEKEDQYSLKRQQKFRTAAKWVAREFAEIQAVKKVALIGSVASPLQEEKRFQGRGRSPIQLLHSCNDVDLAVWMSDLDCLQELQKARTAALMDILEEKDIGVAHHQVDVFILEPGTDTYLGRLCSFNRCPKGKPECQVPKCGDTLLLKQHDDFVFGQKTIGKGCSIVLYVSDK